MKTNIRMLTQAGICLASSMVLSYFKLYQLPQGGAIDIDMIPLFIFALIWGWKYGVLNGIVFGILHFIFNGQIFSTNILSIVFDYIAAFGVLGFAGMFNNSYISALVGCFFAGLLRFISHVISGYLVFGEYAPKGQNPLIYSIVYNGGYMIPNIIICVIIIAFIYKPVIKYANTNKK